mgnify:CR=1 FL=1
MLFSRASRQLSAWLLPTGYLYQVFGEMVVQCGAVRPSSARSTDSAKYGLFPSLREQSQPQLSPQGWRVLSLVQFKLLSFRIFSDSLFPEPSRSTQYFRGETSSSLGKNTALGLILLAWRCFDKGTGVGRRLKIGRFPALGWQAWDTRNGILASTGSSLALYRPSNFERWRQLGG